MRKMGIVWLAMALVCATPAWSSSREGKGAPAAKKGGGPMAAKPKEAGRSAQPPAAAAPAAANAPIASELAQLQEMIEAQSKQIAAQQKQIDDLQRQIAARAPAGVSAASSAAATPDSVAPATAVAEAANASPSAAETAANVPPTGAAASAAAIARRPLLGKGQPSGSEPDSPLQFRIGSAYITPVGFMDLTGVVRSTNGGSGIGTNFAGIPYGTAANYQNNLSEFRMSMQNSRLGMRIDANVEGGRVIGYWESDFLGAAPSNVAVSSNSNTFRSRLFWVDYRKGPWEFLGGQTWTLATPNRDGVSPLPADVFFSDNFDTNYQLGMVWGRIPEFRVAYHFPKDKAAFAVAIDSPDAYMGGTNGSAAITLPAGFSYYSNGELDAGGGTLGPPNRGPDVIAKFVVDPSKRFHGEIGGIARFFQTYNQATHTNYSATGGAGFINLDLGIVGGLRALSHNYWSDGGGRYIFGQAPDMVVRADGSLSLVHSGSTVDGFEFSHGHNTFAAYYGLVYVSRNVTLNTNSCPIGWGYYPLGTCEGSPNGQNRSIQEASFDYNHTFWSNPKYGGLTMFLQYSYLTRSPWYVPAGAPRNANANMGWFDLRYTLPGSAPTLGKY